MDFDFNDHTNYPFIAHLEAHAEALVAEGCALDDSAFFPLPQDDEESSGDGFFVCPIFLNAHEDDVPAEILARGRARCPSAARILGTIEGLKLGGYMALPPGGSVEARSEERDDDVVRAYLAVQLPDDERAQWEVGTVRLIDPRLPLGTSNTSANRRLVLIVDVKMGFSIPDRALHHWGPELPPEGEE